MLQNEKQIIRIWKFIIIIRYLFFIYYYYYYYFPSLLATKNLQNHLFFEILVSNFAFLAKFRQIFFLNLKNIGTLTSLTSLSAHSYLPTYLSALTYLPTWLFSPPPMPTRSSPPSSPLLLPRQDNATLPWLLPACFCISATAFRIGRGKAAFQSPSPSGGDWKPTLLKGGGNEWLIGACCCIARSASMLWELLSSCCCGAFSPKCKIKCLSCGGAFSGVFLSYSGVRCGLCTMQGALQH